MSPTTISATGIWTTWLARTTVNFCSCSMRLCRPRNCFSLLQSLKAVTRTTQMTERRMAAPSIQPASASPSSSAPPWAVAHPAENNESGGWGPQADGSSPPGFKAQECQVTNGDDQMTRVLPFSTSGCQDLDKGFKRTNSHSGHSAHFTDVEVEASQSSPATSQPGKGREGARM